MKQCIVMTVFVEGQQDVHVPVDEYPSTLNTMYFCGVLSLIQL